MTPEQEYNHERAAEAVAALDHLYGAWRGRLSSRELSCMFAVTAALQRAGGEDRQ
ncbi:MAG: hypothetical protein ACRDPD_00835 [Streptosporangiaceae bacterium]